jgi:cell shape-determining protein MreC
VSVEEESAGKQQELNMLLEEVNRSSSTNESLEQQNADLKQNLAAKNTPNRLAGAYWISMRSLDSLRVDLE